MNTFSETTITFFIKSFMSANESRSYRLFLILLYISGAAVFFYYLFTGWSYYMADLMQRPHMEVHRLLKPGGIWGHGLGMVGSLLMVLLLLYSVRKRFSLFRNLGSIGRWLDIHILFGIMGPLLVILHTSFKLNGIVAISFWSMIAVALSGVLGRYIYAQIPRGIQGNELSLQEVEKLDQQLTRTLTEKFKLDEYQIKRLQHIGIKKIDSSDSLLRIFFSILIADVLFTFRRPFMRRQLRRIVNISGKALKQVQDLARQKAALQRRVILWQKIHHIFHNWHIIHKPFAVTMYLIMLIHVVISVFLGYKWVF
jgi:hypothetical protein